MSRPRRDARISAPATADLEELLRATGASTAIAELLADEHLRYDLYLAALEATAPEDEVRLIDVVLREPDATMRDAALGATVDRRASTLALEEFASWFEERSPQLRTSTFARQRGDEWILYGRIAAGLDVAPKDYLNSSDWLQRKLSAETTSEQVLEVLAEHGRTKRIRGRARERLLPTRR